MKMTKSEFVIIIVRSNMEREEEILNAAREYNNGITLSSPSNVLHFEAGAQWADEHPQDVWHEASEMPKEEEWILIQFDEDSYDALVFCDMNAVAFRNCCKKCGSIRWAYINDLLPKTKEL